MERHCVGIDLHRRRSVVVRMNEDGESCRRSRSTTTRVTLGLALAEAGSDPEVSPEATYGWYGGGPTSLRVARWS